MPPTLPNPDPYLIYFDDTAVGDASVINGVNSSAGAHTWSNSFGDNKGLDTWTYYPSGIAQLNGGVTLRQADLEVVTNTHSPAALSTGSTVTDTIVVRNNGPDDTTNAAFTDTIPAGITSVNWTCTVSPVAAGNSCGAASGTGNAINTTVNLKNGATATYVVTGTVSSSGTLTNTAKIIRTNDTTDPDDINKTGAGNNSKTDTTTVSAVSVPPNLLLVKRITAINGVDVTGFQDGVNTPGNSNNVGTKAVEDNNALWPSPNITSLRGAINSSTIAPTVSLKPGEEVEYTIYFLNNGAAQANNVNICDFVPANQTYVNTGYNSSSFSNDTGGLAGSNYGIAILSANAATPVKATNALDGDRGQFYNSGFPSACTGTNSARGAVVVNMGIVPNATAAGTPANSYGFIRFKAKID